MNVCNYWQSNATTSICPLRLVTSHFSLPVLSKPSSSEKGSLKLVWCERNPRSDLYWRWEHTSHVGNLQGGLFQRWEPEIPEAGVLQRVAERWQAALLSPNPLPCQPGVKWTLVGSACSICPQLLMITCTGLSTSCCPHEPAKLCVCCWC